MGNIAETMTSNAKQFTVTREMLTAVARDQSEKKFTGKIIHCSPQNQSLISTYWLHVHACICLLPKLSLCAIMAKTLSWFKTKEKQKIYIYENISWKSNLEYGFSKLESSKMHSTWYQEVTGWCHVAWRSKLESP